MNKSTEQMVRGRADSRCEYCHLPEALTKLKFSVDHVRAKQHGGNDEVENLALACAYCNLHKGPNIAGIDSQTDQMSRIFHPRTDVWVEHFQWRGAIILGITPVGRATTAVLSMNSHFQLSIRRALMAEGTFMMP